MGSPSVLASQMRGGAVFVGGAGACPNTSRYRSALHPSAPLTLRAVRENQRVTCFRNGSRRERETLESRLTSFLITNRSILLISTSVDQYGFCPVFAVFSESHCLSRGWADLLGHASVEPEIIWTIMSRPGPHRSLQWCRWWCIHVLYTIND